MWQLGQNLGFQCGFHILLFSLLISFLRSSGPVQCPGSEEHRKWLVAEIRAPKILRLPSHFFVLFLCRVSTATREHCRSLTQSVRQDRSHGDQVERSTRRRTDANSSSHRESASSCSSADCFASQVGQAESCSRLRRVAPFDKPEFDESRFVSQSTECSNRAQRRPSGGQAERQRDVEVDQRGNTDGFNRTKGDRVTIEDTAQQSFLAQ